MIKQIPSDKIKDFVKENPRSILLDVRTKEEWDQGKPDGDKMGIKTYFLSLQFQGRIINENFLQEFENLKIDKNFEILVMCGSGNRSQRAAELLNKKGFKCLNVSDGFRGDGVEKIGWKNNQLPTK
jgi:rhodanese-related sulfurtransferase|tara:strand:+ start:191 stop:568 length:378 start_codon:yes stop_codon:yes gene_type:complete